MNAESMNAMMIETFKKWKMTLNNVTMGVIMIKEGLWGGGVPLYLNGNGEGLDAIRAG